MYLLDTDTVSNFLRGHDRTAQRVLATPAERIHITVVTVEELVRGRLDTIHRCRSDAVRLPAAYDGLERLLQDLRKFNVRSYSPAAEARFRTFPAAVTRAGSQDCRIAAVAIEAGLTVVTCNFRHFQRIPGVQCVDWSV